METSWECDICGKSYSSKVMLDKHDCDLWKPKFWDEDNWDVKENEKDLMNDEIDETLDSSSGHTSLERLSELKNAKSKQSESTNTKVHGTNNLLSDSTRNLILQGTQELQQAKNSSKCDTNNAKKQNYSDSSKETGEASGSKPQGQGANARQCSFCDEIYDKYSNLKNHTLNHFKDQLLADLPNLKPYFCPTCNAPSRDKITLMRHYANTHRIIFKYCSEEQLKGKPVGAAAIKAQSHSNNKVVRKSPLKESSVHNRNTNNQKTTIERNKTLNDSKEQLDKNKILSASLQQIKNSLALEKSKLLEKDHFSTIRERLEKNKIVISKHDDDRFSSLKRPSTANSALAQLARKIQANTSPYLNQSKIRSVLSKDSLKSIGRSPIMKNRPNPNRFSLNDKKVSIGQTRLTLQPPIRNDGRDTESSLNISLEEDLNSYNANELAKSHSNAILESLKEDHNIDMNKEYIEEALTKYKDYTSTNDNNEENDSAELELDLDVEDGGDATVYFLNNNVSIIKPSIYKNTKEQDCINALLDNDGDAEPINQYEDEPDNSEDEVNDEVSTNKDKRRKLTSTSKSLKHDTDVMKASRNLDFSITHERDLKWKALEGEFAAFADLPMD